MASKYKRDLKTPLAESKLDPRDTNKDGVVSEKEKHSAAMKKQKQDNKLSNLKSKGAAQSKNLSSGKKKSGAIKGGGLKKAAGAISTTLGMVSGVAGLMSGLKKNN